MKKEVESSNLLDTIMDEFPSDEVEQNMLDKLVDDLVECDKDDVKKVKDDSEKNTYHYTSPVGLKGILEKPSLRFTDYRFLNDRSEKIYAFKLFVQCMKEEENFLKSNFYDTILSRICEGNNKYEAYNKTINNLFERNYYVASFSNNDNSLSMWGYYTKTANKTGYCIKFNNKELISTLSNRSFNYYQVNYNKEEQKNEFKKYIHIFNEAWDDSKSDIYLNWVQGLLLDLIDLTSLRFKHPSFSNEEEFRIVYRIDSQDKIKNEGLLKFRESNGIMIPYLEINFEKNSIVGVKISPTQQDLMAKEGLFLMLKHLEYDHLSENDITISDIPLRY